MDNDYYKFVKNLIIFSVILVVAGFAAQYVISEKFLSVVWPFLFVFFFAITLLVNYSLRKLQRKKESSFIRMFMLLTFAKLMFFLFVMVIYAFIYRNDAVAFIVNFFVLYLFYTIFEVIQNLKFVKSNSAGKID